MHVSAQPQHQHLSRAQFDRRPRARQPVAASPDKPVWSGTEIAAELSVARSTGYRYVQSLVRIGFLEENASGLRLGPRIFQLARSARIGLGLSEVSLPVMRDLAAAVGERVLLTRRSGRSVVRLDLVETPQAVRLSYERGHVLPINAGASAEVLLAWADSRTVASVLGQAPLERFSARTVTDPDDLRARLAGIRKRGVAISRGELDEHILGVAAPIRDSSGKVCAAISVAALAAGLPARDCPKWRVRSETRRRPSPETLNFSAIDARPDKQESHRGAHTGRQRPGRPGSGPPAEAPGGLSRNSTRLLRRQPGPLDSQADPARNFRILKIAIDFLKTVTMLKSTSDPVKGDGQS
ncbi:IclR family transcriptional regulator [Amycolatopsis echigonensis]|uniref:IclR family transcriptional regulator n=1 Tax=Amycolatopsis echigonensis TaxID=2576905 RepID=UPI001FC9981A|nr:IclR family transcriptional regulator [Amycolatopsis niigatensis]